MFRCFRCFRCCLALLLTAAAAAAQSPAPTGDAEAAAFAIAGKAFQAARYGEALADFRQLAAEHPDNDVYRKFGAEAALDTGDAQFALDNLPSIVAAHPDDWQARLLLARAFQQTAGEDDHKQKRDEQIAFVTREHNDGQHPQLARLRDFLLETVHEGDQTVQFYPAFVPWGEYNVNLIARVFDAQGKPGLRITLESLDLDQTTFARQHPREAAAGERGYSLDGYGPDQKGPDGATIQTHYTFGFLVGKPAYDVLRERILAIAAGKTSALSSRTGPVQ